MFTIRHLILITGHIISALLPRTTQPKPYLPGHTDQAWEETNQLHHKTCSQPLTMQVDIYRSWLTISSSVCEPFPKPRNLLLCKKLQNIMKLSVLGNKKNLKFRMVSKTEIMDSFSSYVDPLNIRFYQLVY